MELRHDVFRALLVALLVQCAGGMTNGLTAKSSSSSSGKFSRTDDTVVHKKVDMPGLIAGGSKDALLYYPVAAETAANSSVPFLSFAHGMATNAEEYDDLLTKVAAAGFIILAPR